MKKLLLVALFCVCIFQCFTDEGICLSNASDIKIGKVGFSSEYAMLATNLGISSAAANKVMNIIDNYGDVAMAISLIGLVVGVSGVTAAVVAIARKLAIRYGRASAVSW